MEHEILKPDFGRMEAIFGYNNLTRQLLSQEWEGISKGTIPYPVNENLALLALFEEYGLESFKNDLLFIAHKCQKQKNEDLRIKDFMKSIAGGSEQHIEALINPDQTEPPVPE